MLRQQQRHCALCTAAGNGEEERRATINGAGVRMDSTARRSKGAEPGIRGITTPTAIALGANAAETVVAAVAYAEAECQAPAGGLRLRFSASARMAAHHRSERTTLWCPRSAASDRDVRLTASAYVNVYSKAHCCSSFPATTAAVIVLEDRLDQGRVLIRSSAHQQRRDLAVACDDCDTPAAQQQGRGEVAFVLRNVRQWRDAFAVRRPRIAAMVVE